MVAGLDLALAIRPLREQTKENVLVQAYVLWGGGRRDRRSFLVLHYETWFFIAFSFCRKGIHFLTACDAVSEAGVSLNSLLDRSTVLDGYAERQCRLGRGL